MDTGNRPNAPRTRSGSPRHAARGQNDLLSSAGASRAYRRDAQGNPIRQDGSTPQTTRRRSAQPNRPARPRTLGEAIRQNIVGILSVVAVAIVAVVLLTVVGGMDGTSSQKGNESLAVNDTAYSYTSPYTWTNLDRTDNRFRYVVNGKVKSRLGIDVSENQQYIDWDAVAGDGIDFAMIRVGYRGATEGDLYLDDYFDVNMEGARQADIDRGVYFFSQAVSVEEAVEEAEFVLEHLNGAKLQYPVAYDSELVRVGDASPRTADLTRDQMAAIAKAFCDRIERAGYKSMVYGNASDLTRYGRAFLNGRQLWWAEYNTPVPSARIDLTMWQYSNGGTVDGISTSVDMNIDLSKCR